MSDLVGNPEDRFSGVAAQIIHGKNNEEKININISNKFNRCTTKLMEDTQNILNVFLK